MKEFKITAQAIQNIVSLLNELPFKQVAHLITSLPNGMIQLNGVSKIESPAVKEEKKDGDSRNKDKQ